MKKIYSMKPLRIVCLLMAIFLLSACQSEEPSALNDEPILLSDAELTDNKYSLFSVYDQLDADFEYVIAEDAASDVVYIGKYKNSENSLYYLVPLRRGTTTMVFNNNETGETAEIFIDNAQMPAISRDSLTSNITTAGFNVNEDTEQARNKDTLITTDGQDVLIFKDDDFYGWFGQMDDMKSVNVTLSIPGEYYFEYKLLDEIERFGPVIITTPAFEFQPEKYQVRLGLPNLLSSVQVLLNENFIRYQQNTSIQDIGDNTLKVQYMDESGTPQIIEEVVFNISPNFIRTDTNAPLISGEDARISEPLTFELKNTPQEITLNGEEINPEDPINIRQVGTYEVVINGAGGTSYGYTIEYTNELRNDILSIWYVYVGLLVFAGVGLYVKVPKVFK